MGSSRYEWLSQCGHRAACCTVGSDAVGSRPLVSYTVTACGSHPYSADLLIGGAARLTDIQQYPPQLARLCRRCECSGGATWCLAYGGSPADGLAQHRPDYRSDRTARASY